MWLILSLALLSQPPDAVPETLPDEAEAERLSEAEDAARAEAEARLAQAEEIADEISDLQGQLIALGQAIGSSETLANQTEAELGRLADREAEILFRLDQDREVLIDVLAALQQIELQAPPAVLAAPDDAADAARAATLMSEIAPALRERADALLVELDALAAVRLSREEEQASLAATETTLFSQRRQLEDLIRQRQTLERTRRSEAEAFQTQASSLAEQAEDIRNLLAEIRRMSDVVPTLHPSRRVRPDEIPTPRPRPVRTMVAARAITTPVATLRFPDARGRLPRPAIGEIVRRFGQRDDNGDTAEGIFIRTRPQAQVISPFDGRIEYAGPFTTYGGLLILNVGDDYYIVLAGMAATYATAGQQVLAGEPVGAMPDGTNPAPDLYLELRRGSTAVNPEPWLQSGTPAG